MKLYFVETHVFTKRVALLGLEQELRALQEALLSNPEAGATDAGTGGLRKVRVADPGRGKGKRSGARVHYLWMPAHGVIYLMFVYGKDDQDVLSKDQKNELRQVVERIRREWDRRA